jgi:hypothetical protein
MITTVQQTVDIPSDRHLSIDVPESVPTGKASVRLIVETEAADKKASPGAKKMKIVKKEHTNPPVDLRDAQIALAWLHGRTDDSSRKYAGCLKGMGVFKGDPVEIQRKMRSEW